MTSSLRNLPPEVKKALVVSRVNGDRQAIEETSHREGISLNKAAIRLLEEYVRKPLPNLDFEKFFGIWDKETAKEFDEALTWTRTSRNPLTADPTLKLPCPSVLH